MSKRYDEPIDVTPDPIDADAPVGFVWRGRAYEIDLRLTSWREAGEWWRGASRNGAKKPRDREYFRVLARPAGALATGDLDPDGFMVNPGAVFDVYRDRIAGAWKLARIWD